ncbi:hypothetical protein [Occallatibacter riparius]|uniref:Uncharacterized protein n=1 Tax=Occallatibacter riparius TaxID=1002689 RepID=A0A9J7BGQ5_9BACT|nr:hypothetical protein [Occallatibacter riparius]UWZ81927.1 hypothetical protein MOP44_15220 [Occallatibacter riparius]
MRTVLQAISGRAGITLDLPAAGLDSRIFDEQIGPTPVREALLQVLYGSGLNYIIQYASSDPPLVKRLVVSAQAEHASAADQQIASGNGIKQAPKMEIADQAFDGGSEEQPPEESQPLISGPAPNVPGVPANFNLKEAAAQAHKTPGEILDEMQKRQLEILQAQTPQP